MRRVSLRRCRTSTIQTWTGHKFLPYRDDVADIACKYYAQGNLPNEFDVVGAHVIAGVLFLSTGSAHLTQG